MYTPAAFELEPSDVPAFVRDIAAVDLITATPDGLVATLVPVYFDHSVAEQGALLAHVARNNTQWKHADNVPALAIAHGPNGYISPTWYAAKTEHGRVVPTWNYITAHITGRLVAHDDVDWVQDVVTKLTDAHESHRAPAWSIDDAPAVHIAGQLRAIVGLELLIERVEVKVKMSQNRPDTDLAGIIAGLTADGRSDLADLVAKYNASRLA